MEPCRQTIQTEPCKQDHAYITMQTEPCRQICTNRSVQIEPGRQNHADGTYAVRTSLIDMMELNHLLCTGHVGNTCLHYAAEATHMEGRVF